MLTRRIRRTLRRVGAIDRRGYFNFENLNQRFAQAAKELGMTAKELGAITTPLFLKTLWRKKQRWLACN